MASAILGSIPVVIVYALSLDYLISAMTTGTGEVTDRGGRPHRPFGTALD